ncbi:MAG: AAA family ATPase, partial [Clostridium sp.]
MVIKRVLIENYKSFKGKFEIELLKDISIIVGDNESGKTSLLECINLALTNQINGRTSIYELTQYMFNIEVVNEYLGKIRSGQTPDLPRINIELYFNNSDDIMALKGINNS